MKDTAAGGIRATQGTFSSFFFSVSQLNRNMGAVAESQKQAYFTYFFYGIPEQK